MRKEKKNSATLRAIPLLWHGRKIVNEKKKYMRTLLEFDPNGVEGRERKKCTENQPAPTDILTVNLIEPNKTEKYGINSVFFFPSFVERTHMHSRMYTMSFWPLLLERKNKYEKKQVTIEVAAALFEIFLFTYTDTRTLYRAHTYSPTCSDMYVSAREHVCV